MVVEVEMMVLVVGVVTVVVEMMLGRMVLVLVWA